MAAARISSSSPAFALVSSRQPSAARSVGCLLRPRRGDGRLRESQWSKNVGRSVTASTTAAGEPTRPVLPVDEKVDAFLDSVKWDDKGLAVAIAQNLDTGAILMQGFANKDALLTTITSRKATFYSRSRSSLWTKGETSTNFINVHDIFLDCDHDSIIYLGKPDGPTCHTGSETCYFLSVSDVLKNLEADKHRLALTTLYSLEETIGQRKDEIGNSNNGKPSWTKRLLLDNELLCSKVRLILSDKGGLTHGFSKPSVEGPPESLLAWSEAHTDGNKDLPLVAPRDDDSFEDGFKKLEILKLEGTSQPILEEAQAL